MIDPFYTGCMVMGVTAGFTVWAGMSIVGWVIQKCVHANPLVNNTEAFNQLKRNMSFKHNSGYPEQCDLTKQGAMSYDCKQ